MDMSSIPENAEVSLPPETCERRQGRHIMVAIDHHADSRRAFSWALTHLVRLADTLHLIYVLPSLPQRKSAEESALTQGTEVLMDKLTKEAYEVAMVKTETLILEGDAGKVICSEAARLQPAALVMGSRGRGMVKSVLLGSVSEYCARHSICPVVIVPHKEERENELDAE